ncbi:MAG: spore coat protein U domain-containing protein [Gammaproteobacteria bacterium]
MTTSWSNYRLASNRGVPLTLNLLLLGALAFIPKTALASSSCFGNPTVTVSATGVSFGSYDVMNAVATPGTGSVTVSATCPFSNLPVIVNYSIALNTGSSGIFTPRTMSSGTNKLQYNLYTSVSYTSVWGDGTGGTQTVSDQINGTCQYQFFGIGITCSGSQNDTLYGNLPGMQNVAAGSYSDTITVTVNF